MTLKASYDNKSDIPESLASLYKEQGDKFILDAEGVEDVSGLKNALESERELRRSLEKKVGKTNVSNDKLSPSERDELANLRRARQEAEDKALLDKGEYNKLEQRLHTDYGSKLSAKDEDINKYRTSLHETLLENAANVALINHKGDVNLLGRHVKDHLKVEEQDGSFKVFVKDGDTTRYSLKDPKKPMSVDELVETEFLTHDSFAKAFEGRGNSGGGTPSGYSNGRGGSVTITRDQARNPRAYRAAAEAARKAGQQAPLIVNEST